jgi:hypothetical protein
VAIAMFLHARKRESTGDNTISYKTHMSEIAAQTPVLCQICQQPKSPENGTIGEVVRPSLSNFHQEKRPTVGRKGVYLLRRSREIPAGLRQRSPGGRNR